MGIARKKLPFDPSHVLIRGTLREGYNSDRLTLTNPSEAHVLAHVAKGSREDMDSVIDAAQNASEGPWGHMPAFESGHILSNLNELIL